MSSNNRFNHLSSQNIIDKLVTYFSPVAGAKRLQARAAISMATGGYKAGKRDRLPTKNWLPGDGSADADILPELSNIRSRARDLSRNTPIATGAIATNVTNIVGDGLKLQSSIDHKLIGLSETEAEEWESAAEREWDHFCKTCDFTRVQDLNEMQALCLRATLESGDVIVVRRYRKDVGDIYGTKIQIIESDRLSNPGFTADTDKIAGGVEVNNDGVHTAYHITDKHPGDYNRTSLKWQRVPARNGDLRLVIHLYDRLRPEQTRGIPYLAPVVEHLKQLGDYTDAEVTAAVVSAMYTLIIESNADQTETPIGGEKTSVSDELALGAGAVMFLNEGEKANFANPMRPNDKFDPFVQAFLRQIGVALELPFEVLIKHFTASYSASRGALETAWQFFRRRRIWLSGRFCQVVYEWFIQEAVATGRLEAPGFFEDPMIAQAYCGAEWIGPARMSLDPLKESNADKQDIELGVKTREQVCMERTGGEFEKKNTQLGKEELMRKNAGLAPTMPQYQMQSQNPPSQNQDNQDNTSDAEDKTTTGN